MTSRKFSRLIGTISIPFVAQTRKVVWPGGSAVRPDRPGKSCWLKYRLRAPCAASQINLSDV